MSVSHLPKIVGRVRGTDTPNYAENREYEQCHLESNGGSIICDGLPPRTEIVRLGDSWQTLSATATGLTAVPTTAGLLQIWNGEPSNGKFYAIDSVAVTKVIIDVTTDDSYALWCQIIRPPVAAPTDAALAIRSLSGKYSYGGRCRTVATSATISNRWDCLGSAPNTAPVIAGSAWACLDVDVLGRYIVAPGASFTVTASEVTATASTFRFVIRWHEILASLVQ